jgi:hypothetical protein
MTSRHLVCGLVDLIDATPPACGYPRYSGRSVGSQVRQRTVQSASTGGPWKWAGILSAAHVLKGCAVDLDRISIRGLARACHSSSQHPPPAALTQWAGLDLARLILCRSRVGMQSRVVSTFSRVFVVSLAGAGRLEDSDCADSAPLAGSTLTETGVQ